MWTYYIVRRSFKYRYLIYIIIFNFFKVVGGGVKINRGGRPLTSIPPQKKLRNIVENETKSQDTLIELTPNSGSAEITEPLLNLKPTSDHDDRYEKFEAFIKEQRYFNKKIESHISSNSIEISECTIELKDLEQKSKNQAKEVKLSCENHIQAVKDEIGEVVQKLAKQIANLSSKLSSDLKTLKTKASSNEDSIKHILQQLNDNNKSSVYI